MAWTNRVRNQFITGAGASARARSWMYYLKNALVAEGWTVKGSGTGSGGAGAWDNVDRFPSSPPTLDLAWIGLRYAAEGVELLLQTNGSQLELAWLVGAYPNTSPAATASAWPDRTSPPSGEVKHSGSYRMIQDADFYLQVTTNGPAFFSWGKVGTYVCQSYNFAKLSDTKVGDAAPFWSFSFGQGGVNAFETNRLNEAGYQCGISLHPAGVVRTYRVAELKFGSAQIMDQIGPDPVSLKDQLIECIACCIETGVYHIRGKIPGLLRSPNIRSIGDTFNSGAYVVVGHYALPWGSNTIPMS